LALERMARSRRVDERTVGMTYIVNLCFRAKGERDYENLGCVDIGAPLTVEDEQVITLGGRPRRVRIDRSCLIPVHASNVESTPIIYVTEV
jgi:hypothetical protein